MQTWGVILAIAGALFLLGGLLGYLSCVMHRYVARRASLAAYVLGWAIALALIATALLAGISSIALNAELLASVGDPKTIGIIFMLAELCGLLIGYHVRNSNIRRQ